MGLVFPIFYLIPVQKTSIRFKLAIGLKALSHDNALMLGGCFKYLSYPHIHVEAKRKKKQKRKVIVVVDI